MDAVKFYFANHTASGSVLSHRNADMLTKAEDKDASPSAVRSGVG